MEFSADILSISGILVNARAKYGDLSKITYYKAMGESEEAVSHLIDSFETFLDNKGYREDDVLKPEYKKYFEELCLFLIANTEFSKPFVEVKYEHLTYNVPKISKFILVALILNVKLTEYFSSAITKIPLMYSHEVFHEFLPCLDKLEQKQLIDDTCCLLNSILQILKLNKDLNYTDDMDSLLRTVPDFFKRFCGLSRDELEKMKKNTMFKHAGTVLNGLFKLLVTCHEDNILGVFLDHLLITTMTVLQGVSLDMFIYWVEIDLDGGNTLQAEISETAYKIIGLYQQFKPASKMVEMLRPFASKPKDIKEQIQMADLDKMVFMVNKNDCNQEQWFGALVFSQFFANKNALECVDKWHHLCKPEDVSRILNLSTTNEVCKTLAVKCASILKPQDLIEVVIRHFYKNGFVVLNADTQSQLVIFLNKLNDSEPKQEDVVELLILILQNPEHSVAFILKECLKNAFYLSVLKGFFSSLKDVLKVQNMAVNSLLKMMDSTPPDMINHENYAKIFQFFVDVDLMSNDHLILNIISQALLKRTDNKETENMLALVKIINLVDVSVELGENSAKFMEILFKLLTFRTHFIDHCMIYKDLIQAVVLVINNKIRKTSNNISVLVENPTDDKYISFYKKILRNSEENYTLLQHFFGDSSMENHTIDVCHLMKILPGCTTEEWISLCSQIIQKTNANNLINMLGDMTILLCDFTQNQRNSANYSTLVDAMRYCVEQVGIVVQNLILSGNNSLEDEIIVTETLISMLSHIPEDIKEALGLNLIKLMTERSLKANRDDRRFVNKILEIRHKSLCQIIAKTMLD